MKELKSLIQEIKDRRPRPVYFFHGEEPYFMDVFSDYLEEHLLLEEEKGFNQTILYGKELKVDALVEQLKRFPMMSEYQVVIVKEGQHLARTVDQLQAYIENPLPSTILMVNYKGKKLDKRKKLYKALAKSGFLFESKKLYESEISAWLSRCSKEKGLQCSPKAVALLVEYLGTDLSLIENELEKLRLAIGEGKPVDAQQIETYVGISKDFNNFELKKALGEKDFGKAGTILNYFASNPNAHPMVVTLGFLHTYFSQLSRYHALSDKSAPAVAKALRVNPYFVKEYQIAARHYPLKKLSGILQELRRIDGLSKGVGASGWPARELYKELMLCFTR